MGKTIVITPEELYFAGKLLQARYIDYTYVAAMDDIISDYASAEREAIAGLVSSGIMTEDFSGNIEADEASKRILNPIFFGEKEAAIEIYTVSDNPKKDFFRFHFHDGTVTAVTFEDKKMCISEIDVLTIRSIIEKTLPENYGCRETKEAEIKAENVTRFVAVKNIVVGKSSSMRVYVEADGTLYRETENDVFQSVPRNDFITEVYETIKGE